MRRIPIALLLVVAAVTASCAGRTPDLNAVTTSSGDVTDGTATSTLAPDEPTTSALSLVIPPELADFEYRPLTIVDGQITYVLTVAVADSADRRIKGLMNISDLGDLDGMIFIWPQSTTETFWMKDTLLPLDIAFFDGDGNWVDNFSMEPCAEATCEDYSATGPYAYAIEVPATGFSELTPAAKLILEP